MLTNGENMDDKFYGAEPVWWFDNLDFIYKGACKVDLYCYGFKNSNVQLQHVSLDPFCHYKIRIKSKCLETKFV